MTAARPSLLPALTAAIAVHALLLFAVELPDPQARPQLRVTVSTAPGQRHSPADTRAATDQTGPHAESSHGRTVLRTAGTPDAAQTDAPQGEGRSRMSPVVARRRSAAPQASAGTVQPGGSPAPGKLESENARTRSAQADLRAAYIADWKRRVEEQGNRNFPFATVRRGGGNSLTLEVTVAADGGLVRAHIREGSGNRALDRAALDILDAVAPFQEFPPALREQASHLTFAYVWRFVAGERARSSVGAER